MPVLLTLAFWEQVGQALIVAAIEYGLSALLAPDQNPNRQPDAVHQDRDVNVRGTVEYRQLVYGEVQVSGVITWIGISDNADDVLIVVVSVAGHQCEAITDCWLDDRYISNAEIDSSTGTVSSAAFLDSTGASFLKIFKHLGTYGQTADTHLISSINQWDDSHVGSAVAYVAYVLTNNDEVWSAGAPNAFLHLVKGRRLYDPRKDSTNGGSGSHRYNDATTWEWSNNPALCQRDYITGGSIYYDVATPVPIPGGINESNARINDDFIIAHANICDQSVNIPLGLSLTPALTATGSGLTRTVTKSSNGTDGWNERAFSSNAAQSIDLTIAFGNTTKNVIAGLGKHPGDTLNEKQVSFGWSYSTDDGALAIFEDGTKIATYGSYTVGTTTLEITYDGINVKYYKNGTLQRTRSQTGDLYVTSSFNEVGGVVTLTLAACTQKRYTCDTQLSCGDTHATNMNMLLSADLGSINYVNGKYRLRAGAYETPDSSASIGPDDVLGDMELSTSPTGENLYNYVTGTFYDEDRNWKQNTYPPQTQSTYQTDDNGQYQKALDLHATRSNLRAQRIANVFMEQGRNKVTINFSALSPRAINIACGDTFYVTLPEYSYSNQVFRCTQWKFLQSGFIEITAQIESSAAYDDLAITAYTDPASNTPAISQLEKPQTPTGITLTSFPTYIKVTVTLANNLRKGEIVEVWENTSSTPFSAATKVADGAVTTFNIPKRDTTTRYYWVRVRLNGQWSDTYPASAGSSAGADFLQTSDMAVGAATGIYSVYDAGPVTVSNIS